MIKAGEVYFARYVSPKDGLYHNGLVLIVSNNVGNRTNERVIVVPVVHRNNDKILSCNVDIIPDKRVLCNNLHTISKKSLQKFKFNLEADELQQVYKAIMISLGIKTREVELKCK